MKILFKYFVPVMNMRMDNMRRREKLYIVKYGLFSPPLTIGETSVAGR
jgi:hypothetical protein